MLTRRHKLDAKAKSSARARHVQQVHVAKQIIADAATGLIARQFHDAAIELREGGIAKRSAIFQPRNWDQRLKGAIGPAIGRVMLIGAAAELRRHGRLKSHKSTASDYLALLGIDLEDEGIATEMPQDLIDAIEATLADSFKRDYWQNVNNVSAGKIETIINAGTRDGLSIRDMAWELEHQDGYARERGMAIARTESSRALNSGHQEAIKNIEADTGVQLGKTWVSVLGSTTRPSHAEADGQTVASDQPFYVGGHPCQFPGDADLPAEEVVNCQCTVISAAGDFESDDGQSTDVL